MENTQIIRAALKAEGITECGFLPRTHFRVLNERLMQRCDGLQSAVVFLIPYRCDASPKDGLNISLYARVKDYHAYFAALSERLLAALRSIFPDERFAGFCDHSPIDEKDAAARCGLGVLGRNSLLINATYGSFVFIGSLLTSLALSENRSYTAELCCGCGRCERACPVSAMTGSGIDGPNAYPGLRRKSAKRPRTKPCCGKPAPSGAATSASSPAR